MDLSYAFLAAINLYILFFSSINLYIQKEAACAICMSREMLQYLIDLIDFSIPTTRRRRMRATVEQLMGFRVRVHTWACGDAELQDSKSACALRRWRA